MGFIRQGDVDEDCTTECRECGLEFTGTGTWDVEHHDGYGTRRELFPDDDACPACCGEADCEGTFAYDKSGKYVAIKCNSDTASTRYCPEEDGSRSRIGNYCDECYKFYEEPS